MFLPIAYIGAPIARRKGGSRGQPAINHRVAAFVHSGEMVHEPVPPISTDHASPDASAMAVSPMPVIRALLIGGITGALALMLFVLLAHVSMSGDREAIAHAVRDGFASGALKAHESGWRFGDVEIGAHQYNDCLILYQAIDDRAPVNQRAITPLSAPVGTENLCQATLTLAQGEASDTPRFYHNYLHAHTSLARILVPVMGVEGLRGFYKLTISLMLVAGIAFAVIGLAQRRRVTENAFWLLLFAIFSRWFGLESFGQSLGHGPADAILLGFLLFLSRASRDRPIGERVAVVASAIFGALTLAFEFLTGGIPLGLAAIIGCVPMAVVSSAHLASTVRDSVLAFIAAIATMAVGKLLLIAIFFGTAPLSAAIGQLLFRTGVSHAPNLDGTAGWGEFFGRVWAGLDALAPGMHWLTVAMLTAAIAVGIWGYGQLRRADSAQLRLRATALAASAIVIPAWMVLMWQHTAQHAWFMDRILIWILVAGWGLFLLALVSAPTPKTADKVMAGN